MSMFNWTFSGLKGWIPSNLALTFWTQSLRCVSQIHITDPWTRTNSNRFANDLCTLGFFSRSLFLVARKSHLIGCFGLFAPKFCEVVGTYEWYFVILWMQVQCWGYQTLPYAKKIVLKVLHSQGTSTRGSLGPRAITVELSQHLIAVVEPWCPLPMSKWVPFYPNEVVPNQLG